MRQLYLGDGLYVQDHGHQMELYTEDASGKRRNVVYLEDHALDAFLSFVELSRLGQNFNRRRMRPSRKGPLK